jgi:hypothetical protein
MIQPVTYRTSAVVLSTLLLAACGKDPAPLSSLPPVKEIPKVAVAQPDDARKAQDIFLTNGDYDRSAVIGKSGNLCTSTCTSQSSAEACKAAIAADGCVEARDDWRANNPNKRSFGDSSGTQGSTTGVTTGGRAQMRQPRAY